MHGKQVRINLNDYQYGANFNAHKSGSSNSGSMSDPKVDRSYF